MNNERQIPFINQVFIEVSKIDEHYKIVSDMPIRLSEKEVCIYTKFNTETGLYDTIDKTSEVAVGQVGFACHYNFERNNLYLKKSGYIKAITEK